MLDDVVEGNLNRAYRAKSERVDLNTESCNVLLLELSSQMTLNKGGL